MNNPKQEAEVKAIIKVLTPNCSIEYFERLLSEIPNVK